MDLNNDSMPPAVKAAYYELQDEPKMTPFNRKDFYKLWLIQHDGLLVLGERRVVIDKPALVLLNPNEPYAFEAKGSTRSGYWCVFTETFLNTNILAGYTNLFQVSSPDVFFPDDKSLSVIKFLFEQIVDDFNSDYTLKNQSIRNKIELLMHEGNKLQSALPDERRQNASSRIARLFLDLLEKQFPISTPEEPLKLKKPADYAGQLAVHVNHLNAVVHEVTGRSTSDHIIGRMLNESKALLTFSDWSVADIAYSLGFEYPNHFSNFFKKHAGVTPLSLRK